MAKRAGPDKKKKKRTEPHMTVIDLPGGLREVTVDGHTWIEGPPPVEPPAEPDRDAMALAHQPQPASIDHTGPAEE